MKRLPALAALSLPLLMAACGASTPPTATGPAGALIPVTVHGAAVTAALPQGIGSLGLPSGAPDLHIEVRVRTAAGQIVAFTNGAYDPSGMGSTTLTLSASNAFTVAVLLPAGAYTLENAALDDAGSSTLLAYGPAVENPLNVSGTGTSASLKTHAVLDPAASTLDFALQTAHLYSNDTTTLILSPRTAGGSATVPTTDIGPITYTLGSATDGTMHGPGSKLGVTVTAQGSQSDSTLDVTASFSAWLRTGPTTAAYQPTEVIFSHAIETNTLNMDMTPPTVTFDAPGSATKNVEQVLHGTAMDDQGIAAVRIYDGVNLLASTDANDGVATVTTDASGNWNGAWTPSSAGTFTLTVLATDSSGNERRVDQSVTVIETVI